MKKVKEMKNESQVMSVSKIRDTKHPMQWMVASIRGSMSGYEQLEGTLKLILEGNLEAPIELDSRDIKIF